MNCSQNIIPQQCAARSVGTANQLFSNLIQTLIAVQCGLSPPELWPQNYAQTTSFKGEFVAFLSRFIVHCPF